MEVKVADLPKLILPKKGKSKHQPPNQLPLFAKEDLLTPNLKKNGKVLTAAQVASIREKVEQVAKDLGFGIKPDLNKFGEVVDYVAGEFIKEGIVEARLYALEMARQALSGNSLIILPTALGKTFIAMLIMAVLLREIKGKILFLAPTKVLCEQHLERLQTILPSIASGILTGRVPKKKRLTVWQQSKIIVATPQTIESSLRRADNVGLAKEVAAAFFDEVHYLCGDYSYAKLAKDYQKYARLCQSVLGELAANEICRFYGLTASPSHNIADTDYLRQALRIESGQVLAKGYGSVDVAPYLYNQEINPWFLEHELVPLQRDLRTEMINCLRTILDKLQDKISRDESDQALDYTLKNKAGEIIGLRTKEFNKVLAVLQETVEDKQRPEDYQSLVDWGVAMRFNTAIKMVNKGISEFADFLAKQYAAVDSSQKIKKSLLAFAGNKSIMAAVATLYTNRLWAGRELPVCLRGIKLVKSEDKQRWQIALSDTKLTALTTLLKQFTGKKILIFTEWRATLRKVKYYLEKNFPERQIGHLTGQASDSRGAAMNQNQQQEAVAKFHQGEFEILVCTSVGEVGLDFPWVDLVILYEPITDVRRYIQSIGRTGRQADGQVVVLVYKNEQEEAAWRILQTRERQVRDIVKFFESKNPTNN